MRLFHVLTLALAAATVLVPQQAAADAGAVVSGTRMRRPRRGRPIDPPRTRRERRSRPPDPPRVRRPRRPRRGRDDSDADVAGVSSMAGDTYGDEAAAVYGDVAPMDAPVDTPEDTIAMPDDPDVVGDAGADTVEDVDEVDDNNAGGDMVEDSDAEITVPEEEADVGDMDADAGDMLVTGEDVDPDAAGMVDGEASDEDEEAIPVEEEDGEMGDTDADMPEEEDGEIEDAGSDEDEAGSDVEAADAVVVDAPEEEDGTADVDMTEEVVTDEPADADGADMSGAGEVPEDGGDGEEEEEDSADVADAGEEEEEEISVGGVEIPADGIEINGDEGGGAVTGMVTATVEGEPRVVNGTASGTLEGGQVKGSIVGSA